MQKLRVIMVEVAVIVGHFVEFYVPDLIVENVLVHLLQKLHLNPFLGLLIQQILQVNRCYVLVYLLPYGLSLAALLPV